MAKLTLSVDDKIIVRARRFAGAHGVSVSKMVEDYPGSLTTDVAKRKIPPHIASLIGIIKSADPDEYKRHLLEKYR
jgi:hypothetical protein